MIMMIILMINKIMHSHSWIGKQKITKNIIFTTFSTYVLVAYKSPINKKKIHECLIMELGAITLT